LIGVNVYFPDLKIGTTNNYGFYSITLPSGDSATILFSYVGFGTETHQISLRNNQELNIFLTSRLQLDEVVITSDRTEKQSESVKMSMISLPVQQIKNIPSLMGEKDVLKVIQLMPGVQKGTEGSSGIYVRGGSPDQNLIILDDAIIYNVSHLFGFFSLFNGDALKSIELTKGGFPARYGGRLSSVLELGMKDGSKEKWHGEGGIGLIATRLTLEGPLVKDKASIIVSGRRTYLDVLTMPFMKKNNKAGYYFYDLNTKINYDFGRNNKLYLSGYFGRDKFYMKENDADNKGKAGIYWGNAIGTLRWNHLFNNQCFGNTSLIYSNYKFAIFSKYKNLNNKVYSAEYNSGIQDVALKYDLDYMPNASHWIKAGFISIFHRFEPHAFVEEDEESNVHHHSNDITRGLESGIYLEDTWQPLQKLKINGGGRFSHFLATKNHYYFFEPRLSFAWQLKNFSALKVSYTNMNQYIHLLTNTGMSLPTDLWVPCTDRIKPQQSQQVAAGYVKDIANPKVSLSLEGYYKTMHNIIGYKEGATYLMLDNIDSPNDVNWEDNVTSGRGWSYGVELLLQKKVGKLNGWIGYTLSWTQIQFDSINYGRKFNARYDRRHDISVVGIYNIKKNITMSATWVFGTGNAISMPLSEYKAEAHNVLNTDYQTQEVNYFGNKNSFRMGPYHRFDFGIQFHKKKRWGERTWEISVYNVYNRKNPFYYYVSSENGKGAIKQVSLFPIIPSITYNFKF
jgi:hypothetical protein